MPSNLILDAKFYEMDNKQSENINPDINNKN
jgi:hypothetical protein